MTFKKKTFGGVKPFLVLAAGFAAAILLSLPLSARAASALNEFVILLDTSGSMADSRKLDNFKLEMIKLVESSIPIDGTWRIRIFTFDQGLSSKSFNRVLRTAQNQQDAELFFNSLQAKGNATWLFQALNGVLAQVEAAQDESQDIVIHVFTDGDNNGGGSSFAENVARFSRLRGSRTSSTELFYHALEGYRPPSGIRSQIDPGKGVFLMEGVKIPPKIKIKPLAFQPSTSTPVQVVATRLGTVERWTWDFGDQTTSQEETPTHQYALQGDYLVTCVAANSAGSGTDQIKITVTGQAPVADFDIEESGSEGPRTRPAAAATHAIPVQFRDKSKGTVTHRSWEFGDQTLPSTEKDPLHWYATPTTYEVKLKVQNQFGEDRISKKITVSPLSSVRFSWSPPKPKYGTEVQFINESVGDLKWIWDFGDGRTSTEKNPKTAYAKPGQYTVRLTGEDVRARRQAMTMAIDVLGDQPPKASFVISRTNLIAGEQVVCTDTSTGLITRREWDFGDRIHVTNAQPAHFYAQAGPFNITLAAIGPGGRDTYSMAVTVQPATVRFELAPDKVVEGEPVRLLNRSQGPFKLWRWEISDGTVYTNQEPTHVFKKAGQHSIKLTGAFAASGPATVASGLPNPLSTNLSIVVGSSYVKPKIVFALHSGDKVVPNGQVLKCAAPFFVQLTNLSTGSIQSWVWDFGDGTTNNMISPTHRFEKKGRYRISLTVKSTRGEVVESAGDHYIWVEAGPPRPFPRAARVPFLVALFVALGFIWRASPLGLRRIRYQVEGNPKKNHKSWTRDLSLKADDCSATLRLRRSFGLRKYFALESKGAVEWLDQNKQKPHRPCLRPRDILVVGRTRHEINYLNQSSITAFRSWLSILILVAAMGWLTRDLFY